MQTTFQRDWHHFLCTSLNYVIIFVDPRGTGLKGRQFRMPVRDRLGLLEAADTVEATRHYAALPYIDEKRVGIWGWVCPSLLDIEAPFSPRLSSFASPTGAT